jgi:hypothetical protein
MGPVAEAVGERVNDQVPLDIGEGLPDLDTPEIGVSLERNARRSRVLLVRRGSGKGQRLGTCLVEGDPRRYLPFMVRNNLTAREMTPHKKKRRLSGSALWRTSTAIYWRYCWMRVVRRPAKPCWSMDSCQLRNSSVVSV